MTTVKDWYYNRMHEKPAGFFKLPATYFDVGVRDGVLVFHDIRVGQIISIQEFKVVFKDLPFEEKTSILIALTNLGVLEKLSERRWNGEIDLHEPMKAPEALREYIKKRQEEQTNE